MAFKNEGFWNGGVEELIESGKGLKSVFQCILINRRMLPVNGLTSKYISHYMKCFIIIIESFLKYGLNMNAQDKKLKEQIRKLLNKKNALLLAHNYQRPEVQDIADLCGDSLELSIKASRTDADIIVFCGVHFMAETSSILCPDKNLARFAKAHTKREISYWDGYGLSGYEKNWTPGYP